MIDSARAILGLTGDVTLAEVDQAWKKRRADAEQRLAQAPTDALKARYREAISQLDTARDFMRVALEPASGLSHTKLADLPSASPDWNDQGATKPLRTLEPGAVLASRYEIRRRIGQGGMGAVYVAWDRTKREEVAIKVLLPHLTAHPEARQRFFDEGKIATSLQHENIVKVHDLVEDAGQYLITMELLQGQTLRSLMQARHQARQPWTPAEAIAIGQAIGSALAHAHRRTVHRDVKPENIWVDDDGQYKLMDFGIARLLSTSQLTATSTALGTAYYMAPEQLKPGASGVDHRADQYALGVVLYELVAGAIPAGRFRSLHEVIKTVPRGLSQAVDRALEQDPTLRFPDMRAFVDALGGRGVGRSIARPLLAGTAAVALLGAVWLFWPAISALLPDPGATAAQKEAAIGAQGVIDTLLRRLEDRQRDIENQLRDARSAVDRFDGQLRMARNDAERTDLGNRLKEAQLNLSIWTDIKALAEPAIFLSQDLVDVRRNKALGESALRENRVADAATALLEAQRTAERLFAATEQLETVVKARQQYQARLATLTRLAQAEGQALATALAPAETLAAQAEREAQEGRFDAAMATWPKAVNELTRLGRELLGQWAAGHTQRAGAAVKAGRLNDADAAARRARLLEQARAAF